MKDKFLCNHVFLPILLGFIVFPIIILVISLSISKDLNCLFVLIVPFIAFIFIILARKLLFAKIEIDDLGIKKIYKKEIINELNWKDIKVVKALPAYCLVFLNEEMSQKDIANNYKTNICFNVTNENINIISKYKNKFQEKITDISILSPYQQDILKN